jgi:hypothetical protein
MAKKPKRAKPTKTRKPPIPPRAKKSVEAGEGYRPETLRSELIVTLRPGVADATARLEAAVRSVRSLRSAAGSLVTLLFGTRAQLERRTSALRERGIAAPDLSRFYQVAAREEDYDDIIAAVRGLDIVERVERKPPADAPYGAPATTTPYSCDETVCCPCCWAPKKTPDFSSRQYYLDQATGGVAARHAWTKPGGRGDRVIIVDIERAWRFTHEDLVGPGGIADVPLGGTPIDCIRERNHGTAVLGMLRGNSKNAIGVTGICPNATVRGYSTRTPGMPQKQIPGTANTSQAIYAATVALTNDYADLNTGHILLLELQRVDPDGYNIAVEWWLPDFLAIQDATACGLIVVAAAGNGHVARLEGADLDHPRYDAAPQNPFKCAASGARVADSGSILVGAGAPPLGTPRVDRSRLTFSNYGTCVDVQGWGQEVVTSGYGCLQGGPDEDRWYMGDFGGTSSASAMIAGVLACVQGHYRATGRALLDSKGARTLLQGGGSPQMDDGPLYPAATQKIGPRPNLRQLIP